MNPLQNKLIHTLLHKLQLMPQKESIILGFTNQRTSSSKEMTMQEAKALIQWLNDKQSKENDACNQMRRKILSMAHKIQWELPCGKVDMVRVNSWSKANSYLKKELNQYTYNELPKLVSQFTTLYNYYINKTIS